MEDDCKTEKDFMDIAVIVKEIIRQEGLRVDMHSEICNKRKEVGAEGCSGCESHAGCKILIVCLMGLLKSMETAKSLGPVGQSILAKVSIDSIHQFIVEKVKEELAKNEELAKK